MSLISPPLTLESAALFTPRASKLKPGDPPSFYARLLVTTAAMQHPGWRELEGAVDELGKQHFGSTEFPIMVKNEQFRSPIRRDVYGKGWPDNVVAFLNVKSGADYKPVVVGPDGHPVADPVEMYPGCTVRVSLRVYAYGAKGATVPPGISFGLNNIQKLSDGPRLKTARPDGTEFGAVGEDLDDLLK